MFDGKREIAKLPASNLKGYGSLIGIGYDTVVETFNLDVDEQFWDLLAFEKKKAMDGDERGKDVSNIGLGREGMQMQSHGGRQGVMFILTSPDFDVDFRSTKTHWNVSVRYSAAGLWQFGVEELRRRAHEALLAVCKPRCLEGDSWQQISSVHFAFDFYSPRFSGDMTPAIFSQFIAHSSSKKKTDFAFQFEKGSAWGRAGYLETFTIGSKANLQVQVYDKGKEIREASGKEWMAKVWEQQGYYPPDNKKFKDVWRLELRFGKQFLKKRNIKTFEDFDRQLEEICIEGITPKRLTQDNGDARIRRRPLHPLWAMSAHALGSPERMLAIGAQETMAREEKARMLEKQMAGTQRSLMFLRNHSVDEADFIEVARNVHKTIFEDPQHQEKCEKIARRYQNIGKARA